MKKHNFSFDVAGLAAYTDQISGELISRAVLGGKTLEYVKVQPGIKGTQSLNLLDSTLSAQAGGCGFNAAGSTEFTQRDITVADFKVNESLCPDTLNDYYLSAFLTPGSNVETVPFEEMIADLKVSQIQSFIENKVWNATVGADGFDGFKTLISSATAGVVVPAAGIAAITTTNALEQVDLLIENLDENVLDRDDLIVFLSYANYRKYVTNLRTANYFHYTPEDAGKDFETFHPGTNVLIAPAKGLNGSERVTLGPAGYYVAGVDLMSDSEELRMWWSMDNQEVRLAAKFKIGAQIAWPQSFVSNDLA